MLWSIDPDVKESGLATFEMTGKLTWVGWIPPFVLGPIYSCDVLVCEKPRIYPGVPGIDANDLIDLAEVVGWHRATIMAGRFKSYYPSDWKAQVPKPIHHARIWEHLTADERALFPKGTAEKIARGRDGFNYGGKVLEPLDACALGMFELKRTARGGTRYRP